MQYIGKLDIERLGKYKEKVITDEVILTDERKEHIQTRHPGDYEKYIKYIPDVIKKPDYILEDGNNEDTVLLLKTINNKSEKIQVVVRLQTITQEFNKCNSILTFWHIRNRNYISTIRKNKLLYKSE